MSISGFATLLQVHHNTIGNWIKDGMPATRARRETIIDVGAAVPWVRARDRRDLQAEIESLRAGRDPEASRGAKLAAEARLLEMDVAEREGGLILAEDVEARWTQIVIAVREAVMAVPGVAVQSGLISPGQEAALGTVCRDALAGLVARAEAAVA